MLVDTVETVEYCVAWTRPQCFYSGTQSREGKQIDTTFRDLETDMIKGRKPVSSGADAVATWKIRGGDAIRDEYQQALAARADD
ncbi:hypothetical protein [Brachybacterium sp. P6-10-X1]|uniref:hypothetical protein n=1 Tax=Brachybacterium sp. P6-10-X1 TaxID=1903186 RepID=UPI0012F98A74|nr:hypothetical protein [Brachybacterium sp. P6-10-X1]